MKVVINADFGGFSLSAEGVMRYAELKGIKLFPWVDKRTLEIYGDAKKAMNDGWAHFATVPVANGSDAVPPGTYFSYYDIDRSDPALIQVVEEMGTRANGSCATLRVVEIPDGIEWTISEYDGSETVEEEHRSWR